MSQLLAASLLTSIALAVPSSMALAWPATCVAQEGNSNDFVAIQQQLLRKLNFEAVIENCDQEWTSVKPVDRPRILAIRSYAHAWNLDNQAALADVNNSLRDDPADPQVWAFCGMAMAYQHETKAGLQYANKAIELNPRMAVCHLSLSFALYMNGEAEQALAAVNHAIRLDANSPDNFWLKASIQSGLDRGAEASRSLDRAIELDPDFASALVDRGYEKFIGNDTEAGLADFAKAETLSPTTGIVQSTRGLARVARATRKGEPDPVLLASGLADIEEALRHSPRRPSILRNKAYVLAVTNQHEDAIEVAKQAIALSPEEIGGYMRIAQVYDFSGDQEKAIEYLNKGIELLPRLHTTYMYLGLMESFRGNDDAAISAYSKALERFPAHEYSLYLRADLLTKTEQYEKAINDYTKLIKLVPRAGVYYWERGAAHEKLGNTQEAMRDKRNARKFGYELFSPMP